MEVRLINITPVGPYPKNVLTAKKNNGCLYLFEEGKLSKCFVKPFNSKEDFEAAFPNIDTLYIDVDILTSKGEMLS